MKLENQILVDLGSHSLKIYEKNSEGLSHLETLSWNLLHSYRPERPHETLTLIERAVESIVAKWTNVVAFGTEVFRRYEELAEHARRMFTKYGASFQVITQEKEASLISQSVTSQLSSISLPSKTGILNVGGGSIQIVYTNKSEIDLHDFGISDINRRFNLNEEPKNFDDCVSSLEKQFSIDAEALVYTGGEYSFLSQFGIRLDESGWCAFEDFLSVVNFCNCNDLSTLETLSPFDPKWMSGSRASNAIVTAIMRKAVLPGFYASDLNIAHGMLKGL